MFSTTDEDEEWRWQCLVDYCGGNWTGSIGWYDIRYDDNNDDNDNNDNNNDDDSDDNGRGMREAVIGVGTLVPREDNGIRNMRLSFHPSHHPTCTSANWTVYHAHEQGRKEQVVLERRNRDVDDETDNDDVANKSNHHQTFYAFSHGILGRTGTNFRILPVIEHGFWYGGMRKTVVVVYGASSRKLKKICFVQQVRIMNDDDDDNDTDNFDVSESNVSHVSVLSKVPSTTLKQFDRSFQRLALTSVESWWYTTGLRFVAREGRGVGLSSRDYLYKHWFGEQRKRRRRQRQGRYQNVVDDNSDVMSMPLLSIVLPNNVVLTCPWRFPDKERFCIRMRTELQRVPQRQRQHDRKQSNKQVVQVIDFWFRNATIDTIVTSHWD